MLPKRDGRSDRAVRGNSTCSAVPEGVVCVRDDDWPLREGRVSSEAWDLTPVSLAVAANIGAVAGALVAREIGEGVADGNPLSFLRSRDARIFCCSLDNFLPGSGWVGEGAGTDCCGSGRGVEERLDDGLALFFSSGMFVRRDSEKG